ncbi:lysine--tRNA ligase, partial [Candidatus Woesearchaeota archaeon]|nr:lysine--tRNA ligase [Candidatus Woesearchaeota archaeon]
MYEYVAKKVLGTTKINYQGVDIDLAPPWPKLEMKEAIKKYANMDVDNMDDADIKDVMSANAIELDGDYNRGLAIAAIFDELCEDKLVGPVHLIHHPKETIPLCKTLRGDPTLLERYESYINGWEICNGYSEQNDPILQRKLLVEQAEEGRAGEEEVHPVDEDFIQAVEIGMPPMSGVGVGVERMAMLLSNAKSIRDSIPFPTMKPTDEHVIEVKVDKPYDGEEVKEEKE